MCREFNPILQCSSSCANYPYSSYLYLSFIYFPNSSLVQVAPGHRMKRVVGLDSCFPRITATHLSLHPIRCNSVSHSKPPCARLLWHIWEKYLHFRWPMEPLDPSELGIPQVINRITWDPKGADFFVQIEII